MVEDGSVRLHGRFGLPRHEPSENDRRGLPRPPWLSAQDAYRGLGIQPPDRGGWNDRELPPWPGYGAGEGADRLASDEQIEGASSGLVVPESEPVDDLTPPRSRKSAEIAADLDASVESSLAWDDDGYRLGGPEPAYADGHFTRQDPWADEDDYRYEESNSVLDALRTGQTPFDGDSLGEPPSRRMSLQPKAIPPSGIPSGFDHMSTDPDEPLAGRPVRRRGPEATVESPPPTQGYGLPVRGTPLPPPPSWPPGAPLPPAWWPPPGSTTWASFQPGVLPPPDWQHDRGAGAESLPAQSHTPLSPTIRRVQTFRASPSLDDAEVIDSRTYAPRSGWRRAVHRATRGHINLGDSRRARAQENLLSQIRQPIVGDVRIAVLSIKGGVGKTTTTLGLGSALATVRRDRVIAVDANPDRGTLAERVHDASTDSTVRDLLTDPNLNRYADVRGHTRMAVSRLEVLASEQDPAAAEIFDEADYRRTIGILGHYYNVILTDCGTGIMHSAMAGVLELAHSIVLVSSPAIDAVRSASATLDWLVQHGHSALVRQGHVVLSAARPGSVGLKLDKVHDFFQARCRSIHFVPFDPHLAEGADVDFEMLKPATRQAYLELAGAVTQNFPHLRTDRA